MARRNALHKCDNARSGPERRFPIAQITGRRPINDAILTEIRTSFSTRPVIIPTKVLFSPLGSEKYRDCLEVAGFWPARDEVVLMVRSLEHVFGAHEGRSRLILLGAGDPYRIEQIIRALGPAAPGEVHLVDLDQHSLDQSARHLLTTTGIEARTICRDFLGSGWEQTPPDMAAAFCMTGGTMANFTRAQMAELLAALAAAGERVSVHFTTNFDPDSGRKSRFETYRDRFTAFTSTIYDTLADDYGIVIDRQDSRVEYEYNPALQAGTSLMRFVTDSEVQVPWTNEKLRFTAGEKIIFGMTRVIRPEEVAEHARSLGMRLDILAPEDGSDLRVFRLENGPRAVRA